VTGKQLLWMAAMAAPVMTGFAAQLKFDVASVKPVDQPWLEVKPKRSGGRITWSTDLRHMLEYAYKLQVWRVSGNLPGSAFIFAIDAETDPAATDDQVRQMFQSLLADRFKLQARLVPKEVEGFAITVARNGPKMKQAQPDDAPPELPEWFLRRATATTVADVEGKAVATGEGAGITAITGRRVPMQQLADALQLVLQLNVFDRTGLTGKYYFGLKFASQDAPADVEAPSLFSAIQDLGLKLEKQKGTVDMLVVEHIETIPTEN
jgi:uncharacterized protein (TIGR03435 family)